MNFIPDVATLHGVRTARWMPAIFSVLLLALAGPSLAAASHPLLKSLEGSWKGSGTIKGGADKPKERLRCRLDQTLSADGNQLSQNMKCAATSFRLFGSGALTYDKKTNRFKGTFTASGGDGQSTLTGRNQGSKSLRLKVVNKGYKQIKNRPGTLSIRMQGASQHVVTLTQRKGKSGRSVEVYRVVYKK